LLIEVTEEMEWFNANIGSLNSTLLQAPEVFKTVGVNLSSHVGDGMIYSLMLILLAQPPITGEGIGIDESAILNVLDNLGPARP
jgi:hypothetical protein